MRSHSQTEVFNAAEIDCLKMAARIVAKLPNVGPTGEPIRCHEVARIVGAVLGMQVCDGLYGFVDHSWLWTTPFIKDDIVGRIGVPNILDPYCVGSLPQVRLVDCSVVSLPHVGWSYRPSGKRTDIHEIFVAEMVGKIAMMI